MSNPDFFLKHPNAESLQCEIYERILFDYGEDDTDIVESYGVCLTPICYIQGNKCDYLKFAQLIDCDTFLRELGVLDLNRKKMQNNLMKFVNNSVPRYYFLPQFEACPDSIIDFQRITSLSLENFSLKSKYASVSSPYAESILNRYCAYSMRIGTPDYFEQHRDRVLKKYLPE